MQTQLGFGYQSICSESGKVCLQLPRAAPGDVGNTLWTRVAALSLARLSSQDVPDAISISLPEAPTESAHFQSQQRLIGAIDVAQLLQCLPRLHEALGLIPSTVLNWM